MGYLILLLLGAAVVYFLIKRSRPATPDDEEPSVAGADPAAVTILKDNSPWLEERWKRADQERAAGQLKTVPKWHFDAATDAQARRLSDCGLPPGDEEFTKGQMSDLIGLFEPVEDYEDEVLRFFKVPLRGMNQSRARDICATLMSDPANEDAFNKRPPTPMNREFYRFHGLPLPSGLTHLQAEEFIAKTLHALPDDQRGEWDSYESLWNDLNDPEWREDYEIKKPSFALFRDAVERARARHTIAEMEDEPQILVDALLELKPDLERGG